MDNLLPSFNLPTSVTDRDTRIILRNATTFKGHMRSPTVKHTAIQRDRQGDRQQQQQQQQQRSQRAANLDSRGSRSAASTAVQMKTMKYNFRSTVRGKKGLSRDQKRALSYYNAENPSPLSLMSSSGTGSAGGDYAYAYAVQSGAGASTRPSTSPGRYSVNSSGRPQTSAGIGTSTGRQIFGSSNSRARPATALVGKTSRSRTTRPRSSIGSYRRAGQRQTLACCVKLTNLSRLGNPVDVFFGLGKGIQNINIPPRSEALRFTPGRRPAADKRVGSDGECNGAEVMLNANIYNLPYKVRSRDDGKQCTYKFCNQDGHRSYMVGWVNYEGNVMSRMILKPGEAYIESSFTTHPWVIERGLEGEDGQNAGIEAAAGEEERALVVVVGAGALAARQNYSVVWSPHCVQQDASISFSSASTKSSQLGSSGKLRRPQSKAEKRRHELMEACNDPIKNSNATVTVVILPRM